MTVNATNALARKALARVGIPVVPNVFAIGRDYSESVSILSARPKSSSVRPPLLCVERINRTLL